MTALHRKLLRDLIQLRTQALAISLVLAVGVATCVMSLGTLQSMERTRARYYDVYRFARVFAALQRAPEVLAARLAGIPGVQEVTTRVVADGTLDVPGLAEPASGRLISLPERPGEGLNRLHLRRGRLPEPGRPGEVLAHEAFADAHHFQPGQRLQAVLHGRREELTLVGIALSPEYIYQIRPGEILPDNRRFGVLWMNRPELAAAFDLEGSFNSVALALTPGASEAEVIRQVDLLTAPFGGHGAHGRDEQVSHRFVSDELRQLRAMALIPPSIFLAVAAFLLQVVLHRLIHTQRGQIATLKAFGYTGREIARHYLGFALLVVLAGTILGTGAGTWMGRGMAALYARFFRFPVFEFELSPGVVAGTAGLGALAGLLAVIGAVRRAARLPPAEAMRPEPPATYRPTLLERMGGQRWLPPTARLVLRQLARRPARALLSALGIGLAIAVMILGSFSHDLIGYVADFQFQRASRYDYGVSLVEPSSSRAVQELRRLPGVLRGEPFRSVPVRLRHGPRARKLALLGLAADRDLFRLLDFDGRPVDLPPGGLVISEKLGELLDLRTGDRVTVEVLEGSRPVREIRVAGMLRDFSGTAAYLDRRALNRWMREGDTVSGAFLAGDPAASAALQSRLKALPRVAGVTSQRATLQSFRETIAANLGRMRLFNVFFGGILVMGVVYNTARITLSEHQRELATLRVLGLTRGEISALLLGELAILTLVAIPLGLLVGQGLAMAAVAGLETETQRFPLVISPATRALAVTVVVLATLASSLFVRHRLDRLDLVAVLKSAD